MPRVQQFDTASQGLQGSVTLHRVLDVGTAGVDDVVVSGETQLEDWNTYQAPASVELGPARVLETRYVEHGMSGPQREQRVIDLGSEDEITSAMEVVNPSLPLHDWQTA